MQTLPGLRRAGLKSRVRVLESKTVYDGRVVKLKVDRIIEPGGIEATREVVSHPGSVVVLPVLPGSRVVLARQFRYAAGQNLWELVAGGLEPGESIRKAAHRELIEETGYRARRLVRLISFFPSPGFVSEQMHLVKATGLTRGRAQPESDERIKTRVFTLSQLRGMMRRNQIRDGKTLVGIAWLLMSRRSRP
jgi:ADP-ribose pyrophosphatase